MARPLKEGLDYFPHDTDAINDKKIQRLISEFGLLGYGFYFALLADIYADMPASYKWSENARIFSRKCRISVTKSQRMLNFCVETRLFNENEFNNDTTLISPSIIERADTVLKARDKKHCVGCDSDYRNYNGNSIIGECRNFKTAKVIKIFCIGWWTPQDKKDNFGQTTTNNCHKETGRFAFYEKLPEHLRR